MENNPIFCAYLANGAAGNLILPDYDVNSNGEVILHAGDRFCRVPFCPKSTKPFSRTNNLRSHLVAQHGKSVAATNVNAAGQNVGGKPSTAAGIAFLQWAHSLARRGPAAALALAPVPAPPPAPAPAPTPAVASKPLLPLQENGHPDGRKMRRMLKDMGHEICAECKVRKRLCGSCGTDEWCDNFDHFDMDSAYKIYNAS